MSPRLRLCLGAFAIGGWLLHCAAGGTPGTGQSGDGTQGGGSSGGSGGGYQSSGATSSGQQAASSSSSGGSEDSDGGLGEESDSGAGSSNCPANSRDPQTAFVNLAVAPGTALNRVENDGIPDDAGGATSPVGWNFYLVDGAMCRDGSPAGIYVHY